MRSQSTEEENVLSAQTVVDQGLKSRDRFWAGQIATEQQLVLAGCRQDGVVACADVQRATHSRYPAAVPVLQRQRKLQRSCRQNV